MSTPLGRGYHFVTPAQWRTWSWSGARTGRDGVDVPVRLFTPFTSLTPEAEPRFATVGAAAPAATHFGDWLWRDGVGHLFVLASGDEAPSTLRAPAALAATMRIVPGRDVLWAAHPGGDAVECFDRATLTRRLRVSLPDARAIDLASDRCHGVIALVERDTAHGRFTWHLVPIDCAGEVGEWLELVGIEAPLGIAVLVDGRVAVLCYAGRRLTFFEQGESVSRLWVELATLATCFVGSSIASDSLGRVFVAGVTYPEREREQPLLLALDGSGRGIEQVGLAQPATGLAAAGETLLVTADGGLFVFEPTTRVPDSVAALEAVGTSPRLEAPEAEDGRRWLRIEAEVVLPAGTALEVRYFAADDPAALDSGERTAGTSLRFVGDESLARPGAAPVAVPLFATRARLLRVVLSLSASAGSALPSIARLSVLYPGVTLMADLPAMYQRDESSPASAIRSLVGVLETTTQDLDARIRGLGDLIQPERAPERWLDYLARWLGVPWSDSLDLEQKRCIVLNAERLTSLRGTRAGLEALLECLVPGRPRRFRVTDMTADLGFAIAGGGGCAGSALPALLPPARKSSARLGRPIAELRLVCPDTPCDLPWEYTGKIGVSVAASGAERARWQPWLESLLADAVPLGTRLALRWVTAAALAGTRLDDDGLVLGYPPEPHLDGDAITGVSRLPGSDARLH